MDAGAANGLRTVHFLTKSEPLDTTLPPTLKLLAPSLRHACAHMLVTFFEAKAWRTQAKEDKLRTLPSCVAAEDKPSNFAQQHAPKSGCA